MNSKIGDPVPDAFPDSRLESLHTPRPPSELIRNTEGVLPKTLELIPGIGHP